MARLALLAAGLAVLAASAVEASKPHYHGHPAGRRASPKEVPQSATCYTEANSNGFYETYTDYAANLGSFDNSFSSCCFYGIWMLYDDYEYNYNDFNRAAYYAWGENDCFNLGQFENQASSLRFSGAPDGYQYDTVNFYEGHYFMGDEQFFYQDAPQFNMDNFGDSVIVSGCSPWTAYQYDNYQGASVCLYPSDTNNCYPGFFETPNDLGGLSREFSSVRRGCYSNNKVYGKAVPKGVKQKIPREGMFIPEE